MARRRKLIEALESGDQIWRVQLEQALGKYGEANTISDRRRALVDILEALTGVVGGLPHPLSNANFALLELGVALMDVEGGASVELFQPSTVHNRPALSVSENMHRALLVAVTTMLMNRGGLSEKEAARQVCEWLATLGQDDWTPEKLIAERHELSRQSSKRRAKQLLPSVLQFLEKQIAHEATKAAIITKVGHSMRWLSASLRRVE